MELDATTIRAAAKAAGLTSIRVRKGAGCYTGDAMVEAQDAKKEGKIQ